MVAKKKSKKTPKHNFGYKSFRLSKRLNVDTSDIPSSWALLKMTLAFMRLHWRKVFGLALIYGIFYMLFVQASFANDLDTVRELLADESEALATAVIASIALGQTATGGDEVTSIYGLIGFVVMSLAYIWMTRRLIAGKKFRIRDVFYEGMYPLFQFSALLFLISLQLIPFLLGASLYSIVSFGGLAITGYEHFIFLFFWFGLALLSAYWLTVSVLALYAVTLPHMSPLQATRAVKKDIQHRRWHIFRRIFMMPVFFGILFLAVFLTVIGNASGWTFQTIGLFTILFVPYANIYLYHLYRSII